MFTGPVEGRRHDIYVLRQSRILDLLEEACDGDNDLVIFGDKGYAQAGRLRAAYKGAQLTDEQKEFNLEMSRVREAVEWSFKVPSAMFTIPHRTVSFMCSCMPS